MSSKKLYLGICICMYLTSHVYGQNATCEQCSEFGEYLGCFNKVCFEPKDQLVYTISQAINYSPDNCTSYCQTLGYMYASIFNRAECMCACNWCCNKTEYEDSRCGIPCSSNLRAFCGGRSSISVYDVSVFSSTNNYCSDWKNESLDDTPEKANPSWSASILAVSSIGGLVLLSIIGFICARIWGIKSAETKKAENQGVKTDEVDCYSQNGKEPTSTVDSYGYLILEGNQRNELGISAASSREDQVHTYSTNTVSAGKKGRSEPNADLNLDDSYKATKAKEIDDHFYHKPADPTDQRHGTTKLVPKYEIISDKPSKNKTKKGMENCLYLKPDLRAANTPKDEFEPKYYMIPDDGVGSEQSDEKLYHWYHC